MFPHGLIMNPWFSAGVLKIMNPLGGGASLEEGLEVCYSAPLFVCSLLVLTWEVRGVGYMLFPPWLP